MTTALLRNNMRTRDAIDRHMIASCQLAEATATEELIDFAGWRCNQLLQQYGARCNTPSVSEASSFARMLFRVNLPDAEALCRLFDVCFPSANRLNPPSAGRIRTARIVSPSFSEMVNTLGVDKTLARRAVLRRTGAGARILGSMSFAPAVLHIQIG